MAREDMMKTKWGEAGRGEKINKQRRQILKLAAAGGAATITTP